MTGKKRIASLIAIMTVTATAVVGLALSLLYDTAFEQQRERLIDTVRSQASLIEAVAQYDQNAASAMSTSNPDHDPFKATLSQLRKAHDKYDGLGETGEFTLARLERGEIVFLLNYRNHESEDPLSISISSPNAEPMRRALSGKSGTVVGLDYRGEKVLAAYEPVRELGIGIVAKIDLSEIRSPFIRAGLISVGIALALILIGAVLSFRIGNPMVRELIAKEAQLRNITATIPGSVYQFVLHPDGGISIPFMSEAFENLTGIKASVLTEDATRLYNYVHKDDHASFNESIQRSARTMAPWDHEFRVVTPERGTIWLNGKSNPSALPDGSILWNGVLVDITERLQMERSMQESQEKFRAISASANDAIVVLDNSGDITFWNDAAERMFGQSLEQVEGKDFHDMFVPMRYRDKFCGGFRKFSETGRGGAMGKNLELHACQLDGTEFPIELSLSGFKLDGEWHSMGIVRDTSKRKLAERELRESEQKYKNIAECIHDVIVKTDLQGEISYVSPSVRRLFGYEPDELVGRNIAVMVPEAEVSALLGLFRLSAASKDIEQCHSNLIKKDGSSANIELRAVPLYENDRLTGSQAVLRDITETKRLQELESRAGRLEMAGTIAGQVAHDFNNLLGPLTAYPDFIREELPKDHPAIHYLEQMEKATIKIADINQDLLAMGRRGHYNLSVLNLNRVVGQAISELEPFPDRLVCKESLSDDLMDILAGPAQVHRLVSNLLHNAIDAVHSRGQITVRTENYCVDKLSVAYGRVCEGEYVKLTISDTGGGIPDDIVQNIFDPFFTSKETDKKRGSGLGLSVVDAVVRDHGGYLDLSTKVGEGTSFYIYFPITRQQDETAELNPLSGGGESVLVVDDDAVNREVYTKVLRKLGYQVNTVESGERAVEFLGNNPHDLVILDMVMPSGIDGAETYRQILKVKPSQKSIVLSGFSESERVVEAQSLGAGAFVRKPVSTDALAAAIRTELDRVAEVTTC
ncbi:MAG: PAS domain S-box protein [candidate division Zixibacteria bacterium]